MDKGQGLEIAGSDYLPAPLVLTGKASERVKGADSETKSGC